MNNKDNELLNELMGNLNSDSSNELDLNNMETMEPEVIEQPIETVDLPDLMTIVPTEDKSEPVGLIEESSVLSDEVPNVFENMETMEPEVIEQPIETEDLPDLMTIVPTKEKSEPVSLVEGSSVLSDEVPNVFENMETIEPEVIEQPIETVDLPDLMTIVPTKEKSEPVSDVSNNVNNNQDNLEYNFNFETNEEIKSTEVIEDSPMVDNIAPDTIDFEVIGDNLWTPSEQEESIAGPDVLDLDAEPEVKLNAFGQPINHELLKNLNDDTNNFVNPNMIVNPFAKQEQQNKVNAEEPKVDYNEVKTKKGYILMAVIFLIIIVFIIFLPKIMSLLGI